MNKLFLKALILSIAMAKVLFSADEFHIMAEKLPPFVYMNYETREAHGIAVEFVKQIAKDINHTQKINLSSWNRGYNLIKDNEGYILFPMSRSKHREKLFKWVGPLFKSTSYLYKRKDSTINIRSLADARKVNRIGIVQNYVGHQILKNKGFNNLFLLYHTRSAIRGLIYKGVDLVEIGDLFFRFRVKEAKIDYKLLENTKVKIYSLYQYIAFSRTTPDAIIQKWQNALDKLKENGIYDKIHKIEYQKALKAFDLK